MVEVRSSGIETDSFHKPVRVSNRVLEKFWGLRKVMGQGEDREIEPPPTPMQSLKSTGLGGN